MKIFATLEERQTNIRLMRWLGEEPQLPGLLPTYVRHSHALALMNPVMFVDIVCFLLIVPALLHLDHTDPSFDRSHSDALLLVLTLYLAFYSVLISVWLHALLAVLEFVLGISAGDQHGPMISINVRSVHSLLLSLQRYNSDTHKSTTITICQVRFGV